MQTPVAMIFFNRPETLARVFARVAAARPPKLFLIADAPRPHHPTDAARCEAARAVVERVDWPCEVVRDYAPENLGCGMRPATGLTNVFAQVDRAIVLEDDCVPDPSFFPFCDEILERYRNDERIAHVAGNNFQQGRRHGDASYFFSRHNICLGGWATWARAWQPFDMELKAWPALRETRWLEYIVGEPRGAAHWRRIFDLAHAAGKQATYSDYQWTFACWLQNGLAVIPNTELCQNIGFGDDATHTFGNDSPWRVERTEPVTFPLRHPPAIMPDAEADLAFNERVVASEPQPVPPRKLRRLVKRALSAFK